MVLIIVMGGNVIVFFHGGVSLLTGIAQCYNHGTNTYKRKISIGITKSK